MADLSTRAPQEIDRKLADMHHELATTRRDHGRYMDTAHRITGDRTTKGYGVGAWLTSDEEVLAQITARATSENTDPAHSRSHTVLNGLAAVQERAEALRNQIAPLEAEHTRRGGWSRFFLVATTGGHIHSSMHCSTCNHRGRPTDFSWLTTLSGQSEAEAVEAKGAMLCTVCFPQAPLEWTNHWEKEAERKAAQACDGSGTFDWIEGTTRFGYVAGNGGRCSHCGGYAAATTNRKVRKHKPAAAEA